MLWALDPYLMLISYYEVLKYHDVHNTPKKWDTKKQTNFSLYKSKQLRAWIFNSTPISTIFYSNPLSSHLQKVTGCFVSPREAFGWAVSLVSLSNLMNCAIIISKCSFYNNLTFTNKPLTVGFCFRHWETIGILLIYTISWVKRTDYSWSKSIRA